MRGVHSSWDITTSLTLLLVFALRVARPAVGDVRLPRSSSSEHHLTLPEAADLAQNRPLWRMMSTYGATQSWVAFQKRWRRRHFQWTWVQHNLDFHVMVQDGTKWLIWRSVSQTVPDSYNRTLMETCTCPTLRWNFEWPWVTLSYSKVFWQLSLLFISGCRFRAAVTR